MTGDKMPQSLARISRAKLRDRRLWTSFRPAAFRGYPLPKSHSVFTNLDGTDTGARCPLFQALSIVQYRKIVDLIRHS